MFAWLKVVYMYPSLTVWWRKEKDNTLSLTKYSYYLAVCVIGLFWNGIYNVLLCKSDAKSLVNGWSILLAERNVWSFCDWLTAAKCAIAGCSDHIQIRRQYELSLAATDNLYHHRLCVHKVSSEDEVSFLYVWQKSGITGCKLDTCVLWSRWLMELSRAANRNPASQAADHIQTCRRWSGISLAATQICHPR